jgi:flagellar motor switch protein FliG
MDFNVWAKALKNEKEIVKSRVFDRMTKRASIMLKEDMECMGPVSQNDSENAKKEILLIIRQMIDCGEIISPYRDYYEELLIDSLLADS